MNWISKLSIAHLGAGKVGGAHPTVKVGGAHPTVKVGGAHPTVKVGGAHPTVRWWWFFFVPNAVSVACVFPGYANQPIPTAQTTIPSTAPQNQIQVAPNSDRFPQSVPNPAPLPSPNPPEIQPPAATPTPAPSETPPPGVTPTPTPSSSPAPTSENIQVNKIEVTDSTVFTPKQFKVITAPFEGKDNVTLQQLTDVVDSITKLYLARGYITSKAILDPKITNGVVKIRVIEGSVEKIEIEGNQRTNTNYIRSRVQLGISKPLSTAKLEDQLRLLRAEPLFENVDAIIRPGKNSGQSILVIRVTEANSFQGSASFDNLSPPVVGAERFGVNLAYSNLTGRGDEIAAAYYRTITGGASLLDFNYTLPLNPTNGTLQLRYAPTSNRVTQKPFDILGIGGDSQLYEISYRQPLVRSYREEFALSVGFAYQNGSTFTFAGPTPFTIGADANGGSRTSVFKFGQDYINRDVSGSWTLRSLFSFGTDFFGATVNPEPIPDSRFFSWLAQLQRTQILNNSNTLIAQGELQLTPNSLLPSQQFVIGGGTSVRGYRQNVRAGDNGFRFSLEDHFTLQRNESAASTFEVAPFADLGLIWNHAGNPNELQNQRFLAGVGLGLIWRPLPRLNIRLDYGVPLINLDDRGNNAQDKGLYFNLNYRFE